MPVAEQELDQIADEALPELNEVYLEAIARESHGLDSTEQWLAFRRMMARVMIMADLIGRAEVIRRSRSSGVSVPTDDSELDQVLVEQFQIGTFLTGPFIEAIRLFRGRIPFLGRVVKALFPAAREAAFFITGVERDTALIKIRDRIAQTLEGMPTDVAGFVDFARSEVGVNLTEARLETVFRTNVVQAVSDGRDAQLRDPAIQSATALWMLREVQDNRTRGNPAGLYPNAGPHFQMDGFVAAPDDDVWRRIGWPGPGGFQCRRSVVPIGWARARRAGWATEDRQLIDSAIVAHNGPRMGFIESGAYPDRGWGG